MQGGVEITTFLQLCVDDPVFLCVSLYFIGQLKDHPQAFILRNLLNLLSLHFMFPMSPELFYIWE